MTMPRTAEGDRCAALLVDAEPSGRPKWCICWHSFRLESSLGRLSACREAFGRMKVSAIDSGLELSGIAGALDFYFREGLLDVLQIAGGELQVRGADIFLQPVQL